MNQDRVNGSYETFYVYQTASCEDIGLPTGDTCIVIKAQHGGNGGWVYAHDDWVWCDGNQADTLAKWGGWNTGADSDWTVESLVYDHDSSWIGAATPVALGGTIVDALESSTEQTNSIEVTFEQSTTKSWERLSGLDIPEGTLFERSVPLIGDDDDDEDDDDNNGKSKKKKAKDDKDKAKDDEDKKKPKLKAELTITASASAEHVWGEENTNKDSVTIHSECKAAPGYKEQCEFTAQQSEVDVPYVMTLSKPGGYTRT